jgi:hypothetical protein
MARRNQSVCILTGVLPSTKLSTNSTPP